MEMTRPLDFGGHPGLHRYNFLLQEQRRNSFQSKTRTSVRKEKRMTALLIIFILFILLDVAALRWGCDSRDDINNAEWTRRQAWLLAHPAHHDS